jgi:carbamoyltransferase
MLTLGIHGNFTHEHQDPENVWLHDSAAAILRDGEIVAAIEEERLSRVKHTSAFPFRAIQHCLDAAGAKLSDCDLIAYNQSELSVAIETRTRFVKDPALPRRFDRAFLAQMLEDRFCDRFGDRSGGVDPARLRFCSHHVAHAWSAFALSGFSRSLVACFDGGGENAPGPDLSGLIGQFDGDSFHVLREDPAEQRSLGLWYRTAMALLGYRLFDEYKVMGLAPYGDPERFKSLAASWYQLLPDGGFSLATADPSAFFMTAHAFGLLEQARRKGEPLTQAHKDLACALQQALEKVILHIVTHFQAQTSERSLCLAGGVAHNCSANGRLLYSGMFDRIFVQPASHDAGGAIGAALHATSKAGGPIRPQQLRHVYLGTPIAGDRAVIHAELERWGSLLRFEEVDPKVGGGIERRTAALLAAGNVVGWVQGRSEFGPRALGNRSILADPRPAANKDRINFMVKKREGYRPFAPSVLARSAASFFDLPAGETDLSFMTFVVTVQEDKRPLLGAITHTDGTARIQTVSEDTSPRYHRLIEEFATLTDIPMLLNTSFNNNAEPIVDSERDAIRCYLTTGIDTLVIGDFLVTSKVDLAAHPDECLALRVAMRPSQRIVRSFATAGTGAVEYSIETATPIKEPPVACSAHMFRLLSALPHDGSVRETLQALGIPASDHAAIASEAFALWQARAIDLHP